MRFDTDTYREILDALTRNKRRSFLTGFGIFWGLFMLLFLIGGGNGLKQLLEKNFEGFATNTVVLAANEAEKPIVAPPPTSLPVDPSTTSQTQ